MAASDQDEWFVTAVLARLGNYCLVSWEATSEGVEYAPSWIHKANMRRQGFHNAITREVGWYTQVPIWNPAMGYFEGHPDIPMPT